MISTISSSMCFLLVFAEFVTAFLPHTLSFQPPAVHRIPISSSSSAMFMTAMDSSSDGERRRRMAEFLNLEPLSESEQRKERLKRDDQARQQFASYGDDLWELREMMTEWSEQLIHHMTSSSSSASSSLNEGDYELTNDDMEPGALQIREHLRQAEQRDPEIVYKVQLEHMMNAQEEGRMVDAQKHKELALKARSCLPQFNLEGLWVGKYGNHGYEMINVTYAGDTLIAFKVTGDKNVPREEITFQTDLSPLRGKTIHQLPLSPIVLTEKAAKKWGTQQLPRYHGLGQVAEEGFVNHQWMDGQLILIGEDYFSFAWVPIEHQIFFGRPSAELALKMLRDGGGAVLKNKTWKSPPTVDDDLSVLKDYASYCLEMTADKIDDDLQGDAFGCIWHGMDTEECYFE